MGGHWCAVKVQRHAFGRIELAWPVEAQADTAPGAGRAEMDARAHLMIEPDDIVAILAVKPLVGGDLAEADGLAGRGGERRLGILRLRQRVEQ